MLRQGEPDAGEQKIDEAQVFLPLRSFQPECLLTDEGDSILEKLLVDCSLVVVEDADLWPQNLQAHRAQTSLANSIAIDMTKELGLKGHFSYSLLRADDHAVTSLRGQRLW